MPTSRHLRAGALPLHALEWNPGGALPVVLLHGWLDHAHSLAPVCAALPTSLRCLALDFRGHGQSGHLPEGTGYEVGQYLADLHALLADAGLSRVHLVGHSLGGVVALACAAAAPAATRPTCCCCHGACLLEPSRWMGKIRRAQRLPPTRLTMVATTRPAAR